jgi:glycosyltransferase involved in cell wall biosynthesis
MNIVIAGHFDYPTGSASASRIRHFARGLLELGHKSYVITMAPIRRPAPDTRDDLWHDRDGVLHFPAGGWLNVDRYRGFVGKARQFLPALYRGTRRARDQVRQLDETVGLDALIGYSNYYFGMSGLVRLCRRRGILVLRDVDEWKGPESLYGRRLNPLFWNDRLDFHIGLRRADGISAISSFLARHFRTQGLPVIRIPAIIDPDQLQPEVPPVADGARPFQLTYLGQLNVRDGPRLMLAAVRQVLAAGDPIVFHVVGASGLSGYARGIADFVNQDPLLKDRVKFWGRLSDQEVNLRLLQSDALIFTRVSGRPSQAAFPTRLPEYLITGRPVITSGVGDIPEYLADGRDAIIVTPDSADAIAAGIRRLIHMPDRGRAIGLAGREKCRQYFDYRPRCREIVAFITELRSARKAAG